MQVAQVVRTDMTRRLPPKLRPRDARKVGRCFYVREPGTLRVSSQAYAHVASAEQLTTCRIRAFMAFMFSSIVELQTQSPEQVCTCSCFSFSL